MLVNNQVTYRRQPYFWPNLLSATRLLIIKLWNRSQQGESSTLGAAYAESGIAAQNGGRSRWSSDWDSAPDSSRSAVACHDDASAGGLADAVGDGSRSRE